MSLFRKRHTSVVSTPEQAGERRQLTILFYDVVGSTALSGAKDAEWLRDVLARVHATAREVLGKHDGTLVQVMGDGGMAYFGYPVSSEDAALSAVRAALDLLEARATIPNAPDLRIGIATGVVVMPEAGASTIAAQLGAIGAAPNLAARLEAVAPPNQVLVGPATHAQTSRAVAYETVDGLQLKGFPDIIRAWRPIRVRSTESRFERDRDTSVPFTGRSVEIAELIKAWEAARAGRGRAILVEGEPGIGKSRILSELSAQATGARTILLQCRPRARGEALFSIIQMYDAAYEQGSDPQLRDAALRTAEQLGLLEDDPSLSPESRREAIVTAVAGILSELADSRPLMVHAEDLHWADEVTLAVLARLATMAVDRRVLLVGTSRPDRQADTLIDGFRPMQLLPVDEAEARAIIEATASVEITTATRDWIVEKADGNPLFLVELTAHACDNTSDRDPSALSGAAVGGLRDLLATRLESAGRAKQTAQIASVLGREYPYHLLVRLTSSYGTEELDVDLKRLVDHGLKDVIAGGNAYSFRHALIRDVAYDSQLRSVRAALHGQIVDLVDNDPTLSDDVPDILLAEHCLAAGRIERGLGLLLDVAEDAVRRSALRGPRAMLERVLEHSEDLEEAPARDLLRLRAYSLLGPLVTLLDGHRAAAPLYEAGQVLYFRLPADERAPFFPILWGWWFTAADLVEQSRRSEILIRDVPPQADPESRLQALHCGWATLFDGGEHDRCLTAISDGLTLYDPDVARQSRYLYGHDARVCGLGERALSAWLTGNLETSAEAIRASEDWAHETAHLASRLHALDIATQVAFFNRDYRGIDRILTRIGTLAGDDMAPVVGAKKQIFSGWMAARPGDTRPFERVRRGLDALRNFGVLEDTPFYADIAAQVADASGNRTAALDAIEAEIAAARATGLVYWLPELLRRRAMMVAPDIATEALDEGFEMAGAQNARMLALRNVATRLDLNLPVPGEVSTTIARMIDDVSDCALRRKVKDALAL